MKTSLALLGAAFVAASPALDVTLEHSVEEGTTVGKLLSYEGSLELVSGTMAMGEFEEEMPDEFSMSLEHSLTLIVSDVYGASEDGGPKSLTRTYASASDEFEGLVVEGFGDDEEITMELESELMGEAVVWTRGEDGYTPKLADEESELDADLLEHLTFDMDALGLLPPAGTDLAEGWQVEAAALGELLAMGGALGGTPADAPDDVGDCLLRAVVLLPMLGELEGDVDLALDEYDEEGGLATITVEAEVTSELEVLEFVEALAEGADFDDLDTMEEANIETELTIEGTLVWNVEGGHLVTAALSAEVARLMEVSGYEADLEMNMTVTLEFEGEASWELEFLDE